MSKSIFSIPLLTLFILNSFLMHSQTDKKATKSWSLVYPNGKTKALILSYDDGLIQDKQMIQILDKYGLKGTFNINSGKLSKVEDWLVGMTGKKAVYVKPNEVKSVYRKHELASHTFSHPHLEEQNKNVILKEVNADIQNIEKLINYSVVSFAYPFGTYDDKVVAALSKTQLSNARTIKNTYRFTLPDTFLLWHPTCHHNEAYKYIDEFKNTTQPLALFYIWGHSWEFDYDIEHNSWSYFEKLCQQLSADNNVWYVGTGKLCKYITASKLLIEKDGILFNNSATPLFVKYNGKVKKLRPGGKLKL